MLLKGDPTVPRNSFIQSIVFSVSYPLLKNPVYISMFLSGLLFFDTFDTERIFMNESFNLPDLPAEVRAQLDRTDTAAPAYSLHLCSAAVHALKSIALSLTSHDCKIVLFYALFVDAPLPHHPSL